MSAPADNAPKWPRDGEFMADRALADTLEHHVSALEQERQWCGNFRAQPRIVNALAEIRTAVAILRTERHR